LSRILFSAAKFEPNHQRSLLKKSMPKNSSRLWDIPALNRSCFSTKRANLFLALAKLEKYELRFSKFLMVNHQNAPLLVLLHIIHIQLIILI